MANAFNITILVPQTRTIFTSDIKHAEKIAQEIQKQIPGSVLTKIRAKIDSPILTDSGVKAA